MFHWGLPLLLSSLFFVLSTSTLGSSPATGPTIKYTASLGEDVECLSEVNAEREAAGLTNFTTASDGTKLTAPDASELQDNSEWKKVCTHLIPTQETAAMAEPSAASPFQDGTYAFKSLTAAKPNCKETVDSWKAAFKNFTGLPPSKTEDENLYKNQDNVSFVALFNPSSRATADCRVVTCTQTTTSATDDAVGSTYSGSGTTKNGYALICKTMPPAFGTGSSAPFTQEQWERIVLSLTGTASIAAPSFVALAIVLSGITTLL
ncbi:SAG family member [Eimeria tenella]|uniref:SAG family member n=1 Tax=Eimeria tenella TaxID=5802 RepID=U6KYM8_EIMTE|nr:SAG family member [Eimeria tenella]CDJ40610.1 SAG family member [Eimeria tenella]|eukprot:XP_013231360.1 SAG family member [Eimeria tenella]